ncbi:MAG: phosphatase PAP2 family protein, partial [Planctomycetaceae bacterium]|nr:phosphatase PAP2 family protein [Planctomycetaceae bacterium]
KPGQHQLWFSHAFSLKGLIFPGLLFLSAWLILPYDPWISLHCHAIPHGEPKALRNILDNVEPFGHGVGVVVASLLVFLLHPNRWLTSLSVFSAGVGGGLLADLLKLSVGRIRPRNFDFATLDVHATFTNFLPILNGKSGSQSFPSAHAATAFGMAVMLSSLYPRARWLFFLMAIMVMGHRLHSGAHYPSDILAGAGLGWLVALFCIRFAVRFRFVTEENCPPTS